MNDLITLPSFCPWEASSFLFFSDNVPDFLFYSHVVALVSVLFFSIFLLRIKDKTLSAKLLLLLFVPFSYWVIVDNMLWATNDPASALFFWNTQILIEPIIFALAFYVVYTFIYKKIPSFKNNLFIFLLVSPLLLLSHTTLNLSGINLYDCVAVEGPLATYYVYFLQLVAAVVIVYIGLRNRSKRINLLFSLAIVTFLVSFTSGNIIGSLTGDWDLAQFGLFGMPLFIGLLTYLISQFRIYNASIVVAEALIIIEWVLIGSLLLIVESTDARIVAMFTLVTSAILGLGLVRSVKKEVSQRKELEQLTEKLEQANLRLQELDKAKSEFISIASHQLRSPITAIRGYASLLLEGSYGDIPAKAIEPLERITDSSKLMAVAIEDYLNISRIESGNMKYNLTDFNLAAETEKTCDDLRTDAVKRGLVLLFRTDIRSMGVVHADVGKTVQIIQNLITNAIKYSEQGSIKVLVRDDVVRKKICVDVSDDGIGMSKETLTILFQKFERAKNANSVNIHGTGLGLFVALKMAEAMGGTIKAHSEGEGKGSRFTFELPLVL